MEPSKIEDLLKRYRNGATTPEENAWVESWYLSEGRQLPKLDKNIDYEAKGEKIWNQILAKQQPKKKPIKLWVRIAAAAAIVLLVGSGIFYINQKEIFSGQQEHFVADIEPGGNKAYLTLANGQKISLTDAANGNIATQSGIRITKTADGQLAYDATGSISNENSAPQFNTIEAPVGGQWQVKLPDGSLVFLNALSSITYPTKFIGNERKVHLKGEAYFEISHNKAMPFKVESLGQTVEVLGTHFNVMAYEDEKTTKTTLLEGAVKISAKGGTQLLKPGEQAQVRQSYIKVTNEIDLEDVVAWKNGYFKFNEDLESIMAKVARWYNVEVVYETKPDPKIGFGGEISRTRDLSEVLKVIQYSGKVHFKIEGRRVIVMK